MSLMSESACPTEIIEFWFAPDHHALWFDSTPEFDALIRRRYLATWQMARDGVLDDWRESSEGCLALVIVLDQFPLNMFRGEARCFSTEARARAVAQHAIDRGFDKAMSVDQRAFLYIPFHHSETLEDQRFAIQLYSGPELKDWHRGVQHHHDIVARFGRFPHRNAILGRNSGPDEIEWLKSPDAFHG